MNNPDSSDLTFTTDGSRLLSESSLMAPESTSSHSHHDSEHGDLSISELSLHDRDTVLSKPFSLLSRPEPTTPTPTAPDIHSDDDKAEVTEEEQKEIMRRERVRAREEKLQSDLFILRKLNSAFATFNEALDAAGSVNTKLAKQLIQTDALLNKYVETLSKSEDVAQLIFDEEWQGAEADDEQLELERLEAIERARREEEEKRLALQRERERQEQEERERVEREARERIEQEKRERLTTRGGRGRSSVRGTATRGTTVSRRATSDGNSRLRPPSTNPATRKPTTGRGTGVTRGTRRS